MSTAGKEKAPTNADIARLLDQLALLLEHQNASPARVARYRDAARLVRELDEPLAGVFARSGRSGLQSVPGLGSSLAATVAQILETGRLPLLERLQGHEPPERMFASIPGIGNALAQRVYKMLKIETLAELDSAAADGRLERVPGFGPRRARAVRDQLAPRMAAASVARAPSDTATAPPLALLLDVDGEYRSRSRAGELRRIAPRRFNPSGKAWLPILHTERDGWSFTATFSNSARAHEHGTTRDWVAIDYEKDGFEGQCTVVTESHGALAGKRVVRGREDECRAHHEGQDAAISRPASVPPQSRIAS